MFSACYAVTGILSENFKNEDVVIQNWLSIQLICVAYFADKEQFAELAKVNEQMLERLMKHKDELAIK